MPIFDYSVIRGLIRTKFKTEKNFLKELKNIGISISAGAFSSKINSKSYFSQMEIWFMCNLLNIPIEDAHKYFFIQKYELNS